MDRSPGGSEASPKLTCAPSHPSHSPAFQGRLPSPEGAVPRDGAPWPQADVDVCHQLVLIEELVANGLWERRTG